MSRSDRKEHKLSIKRSPYHIEFISQLEALLRKDEFITPDKEGEIYTSFFQCITPKNFRKLVQHAIDNESLYQNGYHYFEKSPIGTNTHNNDFLALTYEIYRKKNGHLILVVQTKSKLAELKITEEGILLKRQKKAELLGRGEGWSKIGKPSFCFSIGSDGKIHILNYFTLVARDSNSLEREKEFFDTLPRNSPFFQPMVFGERRKKESRSKLSASTPLALGNGEILEFSDLPKLMAVIKSFALGIQDLKKAKRVHGDLKVDNILYTQEGTITINDFGCTEESKKKNDLSDFYYIIRDFLGEFKQKELSLIVNKLLELINPDNENFPLPVDIFIEKLDTLLQQHDSSNKDNVFNQINEAINLYITRFQQEFGEDQKLQFKVSESYYGYMALHVEQTLKPKNIMFKVKDGDVSNVPVYEAPSVGNVDRMLSEIGSGAGFPYDEPDSYLSKNLEKNKNNFAFQGEEGRNARGRSSGINLAMRIDHISPNDILNNTNGLHPKIVKASSFALPAASIFDPLVHRRSSEYTGFVSTSSDSTFVKCFKYQDKSSWAYMVKQYGAVFEKKEGNIESELSFPGGFDCDDIIAFRRVSDESYLISISYAIDGSRQPSSYFPFDKGSPIFFNIKFLKTASSADVEYVLKRLTEPEAENLPSYNQVWRLARQQLTQEMLGTPCRVLRSTRLPKPFDFEKNTWILMRQGNGLKIFTKDSFSLEIASLPNHIAQLLPPRNCYSPNNELLSWLMSQVNHSQAQSALIKENKSSILDSEEQPHSLVSRIVPTPLAPVLADVALALPKESLEDKKAQAESKIFEQLPEQNRKALEAWNSRQSQRRIIPQTFTLKELWAETDILLNAAQKSMLLPVGSFYRQSDENADKEIGKYTRRFSKLLYEVIELESKESVEEAEMQLKKFLIEVRGKFFPQKPPVIEKNLLGKISMFFSSEDSKEQEKFKEKTQCAENAERALWRLADKDLSKLNAFNAIFIEEMHMTPENVEKMLISLEEARRKDSWSERNAACEDLRRRFKELQISKDEFALKTLREDIIDEICHGTKLETSALVSRNYALRQSAFFQEKDSKPQPKLSNSNLSKRIGS